MINTVINRTVLPSGKEEFFKVRRECPGKLYYPQLRLFQEQIIQVVYPAVFDRDTGPLILENHPSSYS